MEHAVLAGYFRMHPFANKTQIGFDRRFQKDMVLEARSPEVPAVAYNNSMMTSMLMLMMTEVHQDVMKRQHCESYMVVKLAELAVRMHCRAHCCYRMKM